MNMKFKPQDFQPFNPVLFAFGQGKKKQQRKPFLARLVEAILPRTEKPAQPSKN